MIYLTEHIHEEIGFVFTMEQIMMIYMSFWLALLGLVLGSFIDCAVSRWAAGKKMFAGRSHCVSCDHTLGVLDLIPVLSWLVRRGRCRYCREKIPVDCLAAELAGAVAFVCVGIRFGPDAEMGLWFLIYRGNPSLLITGLALVQWLIFAAVLLALSLTDAAKRVIPDRLLIVLAVNRVVWFFVLREGTGTTLDILKACIVPAVLFALVLAAEKLLDKEVMGGGDIKLLFTFALYLSWAQLLLALFVACVAGLVYAVPARKKKGTAVPFGPFLAVGALAAVCFGDPMIQWYFNLF